jgi:hypothetical protein
MKYYSTYVTLHIVFAGMWLIFFAAEIILKNQIENATKIDIKNKLMSIYLQFTNLFGIVGSVGIAVTGIIMVLLNPSWGFFDMSHAHWLATKQILFVIILLNTFLRIIPASKKLRGLMSQDDNEATYTQYRSVVKSNLIINVLVILNFVFAITHRFYS